MIKFYDIIKKKRDGFILSTEEINYFVHGCAGHSIPDYQLSALLMAIFFRGMDERETADLTQAMVQSGQQIDLGLPIAVDKHSTGGVGDTTTLIVAPIVAACGVPVAKMTGRSLGHTGGTVDKLESIPGFTTALSMQQYKEQVAEIGLAIISATTEVAPADKVLYGLRDVTATIESVPLIASSIMSKKLAAGATHIVLDVKFGRGAFMSNLADAQHLAKTMIEIGDRLNRPTVALLTSMESPLGNSIGNALEVQEAISILKKEGGSPDLRQVSLALAREMVLQYYPAMTFAVASKTVEEALDSGRALVKFYDMVKAQGGDLSLGLPIAPFSEKIMASSSGYVTGIDPLLLGGLSVEIGAGRHQKGESIDPTAGFVLAVRVGDRVESGQKLLTVYSRTPITNSLRERLRQAFLFSEKSVGTAPWYMERLNNKGTAQQ